MVPFHQLAAEDRQLEFLPDRVLESRPVSDFPDPSAGQSLFRKGDTTHGSVESLKKPDHFRI
jgi:hypothetical protein